MTDFSSYKIPIIPDINDQPIAPTTTKGQNISYVNQKFNSFVDAMAIVIDDLNTTIQDLQVQIDNLNDKPTATFTFDITDTNSFVIGTIPKSGNITRAVLSGVPDGYFIDFQINGDSLVIDSAINSDDGFQITFNPVTQTVQEFDALEGIAIDSPYNDVTLKLFIQ